MSFHFQTRTSNCSIKLHTLAINLDVKNPNKRGELEYREPAELVSSILEKERQVLALMEEIESLLKEEVMDEA